MILQFVGAGGYIMNISLTYDIECIFKNETFCELKTSTVGFQFATKQCADKFKEVLYMNNGRSMPALLKKVNGTSIFKLFYLKNNRKCHKFQNIALICTFLIVFFLVPNRSQMMAKLQKFQKMKQIEDTVQQALCDSSSKMPLELATCSFEDIML